MAIGLLARIGTGIPFNATDRAHLVFGRDKEMAEDDIELLETALELFNEGVTATLHRRR